MRKGLFWVLMAWMAGYQPSAAQVVAQVPDAGRHRPVPTMTDHIYDESLVESFGMSLGAAPSSPPRSMLLTSIVLVKYFEHWVPQPYNDPVGYCTVGYGHLIGLRRCEDVDPLLFADGITEQQGDALLQGDTVYARRAVQSLVAVALSDEQFSALASFVFNVGKDKFSGSTMLRHLSDGDYKGAAKQFPLWVKANGQVLAGLVTRRACERLLFLGELHLTSNGTLDDRSCTSLGAAPTGTLIDIRVGE